MWVRLNYLYTLSVDHLIWSEDKLQKSPAESINREDSVNSQMRSSYTDKSLCRLVIHSVNNAENRTYHKSNYFELDINKWEY